MDHKTNINSVYEPQFKDLDKLEKAEKSEKIDDKLHKLHKPDSEEPEEFKEWKEYHENILVDWADKALCYRWLHSKATTKYNLLKNLYTIPVIIISTLTGTANFAIERIPEEYQSFCQIAIGSLNILAGIITTISQFLKINELSEAHRVSSISWDKFYRNIRVELVKSPEDRTSVTYVIKASKDEYDRLMETSPSIDNNVIKQFNEIFKVNDKIADNLKKEALKSLNKPEILDSLESTKNIVYKRPKKVNNYNANLLSVIKTKKEQHEREAIIDNFIQEFEKQYSRTPSITEIYDNLDGKITEKTLDTYLTGNKWLNRNKNTSTKLQ